MHVLTTSNVSPRSLKVIAGNKKGVWQ